MKSPFALLKQAAIAAWRGLVELIRRDRAAKGRFAEGLRGNGALALADLVRVVLDPAGLRIILPKRPLRVSADTAIAPEQNGARAGRPLIERQNIPLHEDTPLFIWTALCYTNE